MASNMKVSVYYNLHKKCLSIKSMQGDSYGRVIQHRNSVWMKDVKFIVNEKGRQRVLKEKRKNVHAFVRGLVCEDIIALGLKEVLVTYNPYKYNSFVEKETESCINSAEYVKIDGKRIIAYVRL